MAQTPDGTRQPEPPVKIFTTPEKLKQANDLTTRYRFYERYVGIDDKAAPGFVASYRAAVIEVQKESVEQIKQAPKRTEITKHSIFSERPAEIDGGGKVTSVSRIYERFKVKSDTTQVVLPGEKPLEGMSLLVRNKLGEQPEILNVGDSKHLTEFEYESAARLMFIPQLSLMIPNQVLRIGDTWKVNRRAAQALLADPLMVGDGLVAKLVEIQKQEDGPLSVAQIDLSGKLLTTLGESEIKARVVFTFVGESSLRVFNTKSSSLPRPTDDIIEGRGAITEIRMARLISGVVGGTTRLKYQSERQVTMHRQLGLVDGTPHAKVLTMIPDLTPANSWITHFDPLYQYALEHPQNLIYPERNPAMTELRSTFMVRADRQGRDMFQIQFINKTLAPKDLRIELEEKYKVIKNDVLKGANFEIVKGNDYWLKESDWPKARVYRLDAELKPLDPKGAATIGASRIHFDGYLMNFGESSSILAIASTTRESVAPFRKEIEDSLKSIRLNPPKPPIPN